MRPVGPSPSCSAGRTGSHVTQLLAKDTRNPAARSVRRARGLYIGDIAAIRKISPATDQLTAPAGTGSTTPLGDRGPATSAGLNGSCTAALDPAGNLIVADIVDNRIRAVAATTGTFYGKHMTAGDIYTVAGNGTSGFSGDGGPATSATLSYPDAVAVNGASLVFADQGTSRIRQVTG